jgi:hypothetical protein
MGRRALTETPSVELSRRGALLAGPQDSKIAPHVLGAPPQDWSMCRNVLFALPRINCGPGCPRQLLRPGSRQRDRRRARQPGRTAIRPTRPPTQLLRNRISDPHFGPAFRNRISDPYCCPGVPRRGAGFLLLWHGHAQTRLCPAGWYFTVFEARPCETCQDSRSVGAGDRDPAWMGVRLESGAKVPRSRAVRLLWE